MPRESTEGQSDEKHPQSNRGKLSPEERLSIVKRIEAGEKQAVMATEFGVTRQAISLLMKKYREEGEDVIKEGRRGRKPSRRLSPDEEEAVHLIIKSHKTPKGAGLALAEKGKNKWDADSIKRLVSRECAFTPTKSIVADLLAKWELTPKKERQFSPDYYEYINSDIGKEVSRRNWELREMKLREKREAEAAEAAEKAGGVASADAEDDEMEEMDYTDEELAKIRRQMLAGRQLSGGAGQRSGKHRKGRGAHTPPRKKRKKKRKK